MFYRTERPQRVGAHGMYLELSRPADLSDLFEEVASTNKYCDMRRHGVSSLCAYAVKIVSRAGAHVLFRG